MGSHAGIQTRGIHSRLLHFPSATGSLFGIPLPGATDCSVCGTEGHIDLQWMWYPPTGCRKWFRYRNHRWTRAISYIQIHVACGYSTASRKYILSFRGLLLRPGIPEDRFRSPRMHAFFQQKIRLHIHHSRCRAFPYYNYFFHRLNFSGGYIWL